nr:MAG TPA: hypothetical protein [Caudoviricetes sp.]DAV23065.1 MAG TPA: hypothetical protein [Caudoviricetes sp.]
MLFFDKNKKSSCPLSPNLEHEDILYKKQPFKRSFSCTHFTKNEEKKQCG